ncbi:MAG: tRNA 2-selenouridine(34) synthase MnmH, partial [Nitrosomonadales bacterium]|nr:tRNA 2-selenouridine(34) synthase MnmH [Nitrosomonadales bacterium]
KPLYRFHGAQQLGLWNEMIRAGDFAKMVAELLTLHYDPSYFRATSRNYPQLDQAQRVILEDLSEDALKKVAEKLSLV